MIARENKFKGPDARYSREVATVKMITNKPSGNVQTVKFPMGGKKQLYQRHEVLKLQK